MACAERLHTMGAGGTCICPKCQATLAHRDGVRCQDERCPQCGSKMLRQGSPHHRQWMKKKGPGSAT